MTWDAPSIGYAAARWLSYLAAFVVIGSAIWRWVLLPKLPPDPTGQAEAATARWARVGGLVVAFSLLLRLYFQTRSLLEPEDPITLDFLQAVVSSRWGNGWLAQAVAAIVTLVGWRAVGRSPGSVPAKSIALVGTIGLAASAPLTGHAVGLAEAPRYAPLLDLVHFGGGAIWLGTLGVLMRMARPGGPATVAALVEVFSPLALIAGLTTMAAGALLAWNYLGGLAPLLTTAYGNTLLVKLGALTITALVGGYNWRVVLPKLRQGIDAPIAITTRVEVLAGLLVLACTAVLVATAAPGDHLE